MKNSIAGQQLGAREAILSKIKRALQVPAPRSGAHESHAPKSPAGAVSLPVVNGNSWKQWLPPTGANWDDWAALFARNAEGLKADFRLLENENALPAAMQKLRDENSWQRIAFHAGKLTEMAATALNLPALSIVENYDRNELEKCDAGITLCDALIAQTGSVLITSKSAGGRALSVLPPHHVVIARREQLLPDLPSAFELLRASYGDGLPSLMSFVTGPSRTGDIERILVLGAHGPKQLTIFCV